jgi:predicted 2-oxoglutarate/Fe(II)-dependent dioxygenase YbiX
MNAPASVAPFTPGDAIPDITMPGRDGRPVQLFYQEIAGRTLALWRTGSDVSAEAIAEAERLVPDFAEADAHLIHLVVGAMPKDVPAPQGALTQIFDPKNQITHLFGLENTGIILIDRNRRLAGAFAGQDANRALAFCRQSLAREKGGAIAQQAPVLLIPNIFDDSDLAALLAYWEGNDKSLVNNVARSDSGNTYDGPQIKRRSDTPIQDRALFAMVKTRVERRVFPEVLKAFQCEIARMEMPRIGCYDSAVLGEFKRHRDNTTPYTAHRKFALSINLNSGYEGGAVGFPEYGRSVYSPAPGGGVVFSCSLLHEAQPVTSGRRFGLFTFLTDANGANREDAMLAQQGSAVSRFKVS